MASVFQRATCQRTVEASSDKASRAAARISASPTRQPRASGDAENVLQHHLGLGRGGEPEDVVHDHAEDRAGVFGDQDPAVRRRASEGVFAYHRLCQREGSDSILEFGEPAHEREHLRDVGFHRETDAHAAI